MDKPQISQSASGGKHKGHKVHGNFLIFPLKKFKTEMKKISFSLLLIFILFSCDKNSENRGNKILKDDLGNTVSVALPVNKAVSLAPNLTEIIYFIEAENKLAANTTYCNFPPQAKSKPKIGDLLSVDYEKLLKIKPDIVLMTVEGNQKAQYEKIKNLGFPVFVSNPRSFSGILKTIRDFGKIFGKEKIAELKTEQLQAEFDSLTAEINFHKSKTALFLISVNPLIAAGKNTFIDEYLKSIGIKNSLRETKSSYPVINTEEILKENPDYIIVPSNQKKFFDEKISANKVLQNVNAVKNNKIITVNQDLFFRPGPRFTKALKIFGKKLLTR